MRAFQSNKSMPRRAALLVIVIMALIVVGLVMAALVQCLAMHHTQTRNAEQQQQADWIATAAIERAKQAIKRQTGYSGEHWQIPAETLPSGGPNHAEIRVVPVAGDAEKLRIEIIVAARHAGITRVIQRTERFTDLPEKTAEEARRETP